MRRVRALAAVMVSAVVTTILPATAASGFAPGSEQRHRVFAVEGDDPASLAVEVSRDRHDDDSAGAVVVATSARFPDLLAGGGLVGVLDAPLLLTSGDPSGYDYVDSDTTEEIARVANGATTVYILGGTGAVSQRVEAEIREIAGVAGTSRLAGSDRIATAVAVADFVAARTTSTKVLVARGFGGTATFADALAGGAYAAATGSPILLTETSRLSPATRAWANARSSRSYVLLGGTAAIAQQTEHELRAVAPGVARVAGADRYATAVAIARSASLWNRTEPCAGSVDQVSIANGNAFQAATIAAALKVPVLLSNGPNTDSALSYLSSESCDSAVAVLGAGDIDAEGVARALGSALGRGEPVGSRQNPFPLGEAATTEEGWELAVEDANLDAEDEIAEDDEFAPEPDPGIRFVVISIRATNTTSETMYFNSLGMGLLADGSDVDGYTYCGSGVDDLPSDRDVGPGGTIRGELCYEVPDTVESLIAYWSYTGEYTPFYALQ
jgi:putative cell wall-binding protein